MKKSNSLSFKLTILISTSTAFIIGAIILICSMLLSSRIETLLHSSNTEIVNARSGQIGANVYRIERELVQISIRNRIRSENTEIIKETLLSLNDELPPESVGCFYVFPGGEYYTSLGATGNVSDRSYYKEIMNNNAEYVVSEAMISKSLNLFIVVFAQSVKNSEGKTIGIVAFQIGLEKLTSLTSEIKIGKTGYGWIVENSGLIIAHPSKDFIMTLNTLEGDKEGFKGLSKLMKTATTQDAVTDIYKNQKNKEIIAYTKKIDHTPGWVLIVSMPKSEISEIINSIIYILLIILVVAILITIIISIFLARSLSKPLMLTVSALTSMESGDFTEKTTNTESLRKISNRKDEIGDLGRSIMGFAAKLVEIAKEISAASQRVAGSSSVLSKSAEEISNGANLQASSVEELSASVEELSATIRQNADNTQQANGLAETVSINAQTSGQAVQNAVQSMEEITQKISIIDEISRQTNLLALNAAIEAARAGEAGRGFAVVAGEIRKLAENSQKAAFSIIEESKTGVKTAGDAGTMIRSLIEIIQKTTGLIQDIASASKEQASGTRQIEQGVVSLDTVIQKNAASAEELAGTAEKLAHEADKLAKTISFFKI